MEQQQQFEMRIRKKGRNCFGGGREQEFGHGHDGYGCHVYDNRVRSEKSIVRTGSILNRLALLFIPLLFSCPSGNELSQTDTDAVVDDHTRHCPSLFFKFTEVMAPVNDPANELPFALDPFFV